MKIGFHQRLRSAGERNQSLLCVGLDPDPEQMPVGIDVFEFNRRIIDATKALVCAYKPNVAFYEALGEEGHSALKRTLEYIRATSDIPTIADSKRGDVQSTSKFHAKAMFEVWGFDATTINPYGGRDAVQPFLDYTNKGIFVWCRSSNPGAREFQDLMVTEPGQDCAQDAEPFYIRVARRATGWNDNGNVGLVVGAPYPDELKRVRKICGDMTILIPGVGVQQGPLESAIVGGVDEHGRSAIINVSRSVIYASGSPRDFDEAAGRNASGVRQIINNHLTLIGKGWPELTAVEA